MRARINPDYADFDEIDPDVEEALEGFANGRMTYQELVSLIGQDSAKRVYEDEFGEMEDLFDDPEDFDDIE